LAPRPGTGGDGVGPDYANWDGDHVTVCNCDWGFFGPDCSLRICAKDDDPTTSNQKPRTINIRISGGGTGLGGVFRITFLGFTTELKAESGIATDSECTRAFTGLENVQEATCVGEPYDAGGGGSQFNVTFNRWPRQVR
jgi:hypothetical protein